MDEIEYIIGNDGTKYWYSDDRLHRLNAPAVIFRDGSEQWYVDGELHREDGPAVISANGKRGWYRYGGLHREDGPAIIYSDQSRAFHIKGEEIPIVLSRHDGKNIIFLDYEYAVDFTAYPSYQYNPRLAQGYLDDTDLILFMLTHVVVEMPYG